MQVPRTPHPPPGALSPLQQKRLAARVLAQASADFVREGVHSPGHALAVLRENVLGHYRFDPYGPALWEDACRVFRDGLQGCGVEPDEVLPLPVLAYAPFPVALLPRGVRRLVEETAAALDCDAGAVAPLALAVLGAAIGNTARLGVKRTWNEPCILWAALVADSGFAKSPLLRPVVAPVTERERVARRAHAEALQAHREAEAEARRRKELPPPAPLRPRFRTSDATPEALVSVLAGAPRGVVLVRDELSAWFGGFNRYAGGKGSDEAAWIEFHGGDASDTDRKTGEERTLSVDRPFVAVVGTIQPSILAHAFTPAVVASGLAPRILLAMPPTRALGMPEADTSEEAEAQYRGVCDALYARPLHDAGPERVALAPEAAQAFKAFCDANACRVEALPSGYARSVLDKAKGTAARLALVLHLCDVAGALPPDVPVPPVPAETVRRACLLADWLAREAVRVAALLGVGQGAATPAVQVLQTLPETWRRKDWDAAVKQVRGARSTSSSWLDALLEAGDVEKVRHGLYRAVRLAPSRQDAAFLWAGYPLAEVLGWTTGQPDDWDEARDRGGDGDGACLPTSSALSDCPTVRSDADETDTLF